MKFEVLFDHGEDPVSPDHPSTPTAGAPGTPYDPAVAGYGKLGFPSPAGRPWIYANFVQTLDGIVSLLGDEAGGADISGLREDRWLMDLLRAHADAVILGMGTLRTEQQMQRPRPRGPVFRIMNPELQQLRSRLGRGRERNVLVSARADFQLNDFAVFDGDLVDATVLTTHEGARRLEAQARAGVEVLGVKTECTTVWGIPTLDLTEAVALLQERYGIRYLLCEGGPSLYGSMLTAGLIDEKFLTVSPIEVGDMSVDGRRPTILPGVALGKQDAVRWRWLSCRKVGDHQFHRFRRVS
jgi:riboflavin biosynthesis pyrimidine reductase